MVEADFNFDVDPLLRFGTEARASLFIVDERQGRTGRVT
jgi:hypothetical protein